MASSRLLFALALLLACALLHLPLACAIALPQDVARLALPDLYEASIAELQHGLSTHRFTSVDLVKAYLARIDEVNLKGPALRAVIETGPHVLAQAAALDAERRAGRARGPLHGIPILLKDNIATRASDGLNTTAGKCLHFALLGSIPPRDAHVAARLRAAGAVLLGKANLSEWAHFRGSLASGWSARGGQATSAYFPGADPCGSSSGSGIGASIGLAAAALGSETDGSIVCPSSRNNLVGIKPTVGLTSRAGVVPISVHQDTVGPMARSVADAAALLSVIAGRDARDSFTLAQPARVPDYSAALDPHALRGARLGVPRLFGADDKNIMAAFNASLKTLRALGATIVDNAEFPDAEELLASNNETVVLDTDFKVNVKTYIQGLVKVPTGVRDLADLIKFNDAHAAEELPAPFYTDQSEFIESENTTVNAAYFAALAADADLGRTRGIDGTLKKFKLDAILLPTDGFTSTPAAIAGYPIVTVPLGFQPASVAPTAADPVIETAPGLPFGLSFMGTAFSEFTLISFAYAYEQATHTRLQRRAFAAAIPKTQLADVM